MMKQQFQETFRRAFGALTDKKRRWLVAVGLLGILLIGLSEWLPMRIHREAEVSNSETLTVDALEKALEARITDLVSCVEGVGVCHVVVTLEHGVQYVYATDQTTSNSETGSADSEKTLIVDTENGPVGLLVTELQPAVKGVAIVCDGGSDPDINKQVTALVSTVFNISSRRVCVVGRR